MFGEVFGTLFYYFLLSVFFMVGNVLSAYGGVNVYEEFDQRVLPKFQRALDLCKRKVSPKIVRLQQDLRNDVDSGRSPTAIITSTSRKPE